MTTMKERIRAAGKWLLRNWAQWPTIFVIVQGIISGIAKLDFTRAKLWMIDHPLSSSVLVTTVVVILGSAVSYWKMHAIKSYASVEVLVGALLSFNSASHLAPEFNFSGLLGILSAVYVAARGFNNLSSARLVAPAS